MILVNFLLFRGRLSSHNRRTLGSRFGPMLVNEQLNIRQFKDNSTRRRHSPLPVPLKHRRILDNNRLNLLTMTCFLLGRNSPIDSTISEMVDKGLVANLELVASPKQGTLMNFHLWVEMLQQNCPKTAGAH